MLWLVCMYLEFSCEIVFMWRCTGKLDIPIFRWRNINIIMNGDGFLRSISVSWSYHTCRLWNCCLMFGFCIGYRLSYNFPHVLPLIQFDVNLMCPLRSTIIDEKGYIWRSFEFCLRNPNPSSTNLFTSGDCGLVVDMFEVNSPNSTLLSCQACRVWNCSGVPMMHQIEII